MAAGQVDHPAIVRGIAWLKANQQEDGLWAQPHYTGGGFPRVFYLNYHGYPKFFPLWALARYRNLKTSNSRRGRIRAVNHNCHPRRAVREAQPRGKGTQALTSDRFLSPGFPSPRVADATLGRE